VKIFAKVQKLIAIFIQPARAATETIRMEADEIQRRTVRPAKFNQRLDPDGLRTLWVAKTS